MDVTHAVDRRLCKITARPSFPRFRFCQVPCGEQEKVQVPGHNPGIHSLIHSLIHSFRPPPPFLLNLRILGDICVAECPSPKASILRPALLPLLPYERSHLISLPHS